MNRYILATAWIACATLLVAGAMPLQAREGRDAAVSAEEIVDSLYTLVSFTPGSAPDWGKVKALFLDDARLVLRVSFDSSAVFTVETFVKDFQRFIDNSSAIKTGFQEKIVRTKSLVFGDVAQFTVLYEAHLPGTLRPPQQGVDFILLSRLGERWQIVAIVNEVPAKGRRLPAVLQE